MKREVGFGSKGQPHPDPDKFVHLDGVRAGVVWVGHVTVSGLASFVFRVGGGDEQVQDIAEQIRAHFRHRFTVGTTGIDPQFPQTTGVRDAKHFLAASQRTPFDFIVHLLKHLHKRTFAGVRSHTTLLFGLLGLVPIDGDVWLAVVATIRRRS